MKLPPDNEAKADDPDLQRIRTKLVRLMLGSILITFVLVGLVLSAVIYKIMMPLEQAQSAADTPAEVKILDLEIEGQIVSYSLSGDILILQVKSSEKADEFILYNVHSKQIVSRLRFRN